VYWGDVGDGSQDRTTVPWTSDRRKRRSWFSSTRVALAVHPAALRKAWEPTEFLAPGTLAPLHANAGGPPHHAVIDPRLERSRRAAHFYGNHRVLLEDW